MAELTKCFVIFLALGSNLAHGASGGWASSRYRQGRVVSAEGPLLVTNVFMVTTCLTMCREKVNCSSFQYNSVSGSCELLAYNLCDGNSAGRADLDKDPNWRYFDLHMKKKNLVVFTDLTICTSDGKCSNECAPYLGDACYEDSQCSAVTLDSRCNDTNGDGRCVCNDDFWAYNTSLCQHVEAFRINYHSYTGKRIVNGVCELSFSTNFTEQMDIYLSDKEDFVRGAKEMLIYVGHYGNTRSTLKVDGSTLWGVEEYSGKIFNNSLQNFTVNFCDGQLSFGYEADPPVLSRSVANPFDVNFIAFRGHKAEANGYIFFPHSLVDSYFPKRVETQTIRTNGYSWLEFKLTPTFERLSKFVVRFSYKSNHSDAQPNILFAHFNDNARQYLTRFTHYGRNVDFYNGYTRRRTNHFSSSTSLTSTSVFRTFTITMDQNKFEMAREGDSFPFLSYTHHSSYKPSFSKIAIRTHFYRVGFWKFPSHPEFHEHGDGAYL